MEDITKYIGLLGFVPFVIMFVLLNKVAIKNPEHTGIIVIWGFTWIAVIIFGLIWGITTLGRLL